MSGAVHDNREANRYELEQDGQTAVLNYERRGGQITLVHTEVPESLRGHGLGEALVKGALDLARREGLRIIAVCPFVRAYLRKHPAEGIVSRES